MQYKEMTIKNPRLRKRIRSLTGGSFTRASVAYDPSGNSVPLNTPRFSMFGVSENGLLVEEAHTNLLSGAESLLIENASPVTTGTLNGTYTFSCQTGSYVLSGGATGTVTPSSPQTKAISSATVTLTPDTSATYNQIIKLGYPLSWVLGGTEQKAETMTIPSSVLNIDTGGYSNLLPASQSNTLTAGSPYTTGTLVAEVSYTFSCQTGSYELSGGATGTVTPSTPLTKTPGAATVTLTGDATGNQLSATSVVKPWVLGGTQSNAGAGTIEAEIYITPTFLSTSDKEIFVRDTGTYSRIDSYYRPTGKLLRGGVNDRTNAVSLCSATVSLSQGWHKFCFSWDKSKASYYLDGVLLSGAYTNPYLPVAQGIVLYLGSYTDGTTNIDTLIRNVVVSKTKRADSDITARSVSGYAVDKNVTAILPLKTNTNAYRIGVV